MNATIERYFAPASLDEAAVMMAAGDATVLAGGTDLMPQTNAGRMRFGRTLVNIRRVPELGGIAVDGDAIRLGALTTVTELMASDITSRITMGLSHRV